MDYISAVTDLPLPQNWVCPVMTDQPNEPRVERVQILLTASELQAIDDWRFANHARSRAEAIRRLIELALSTSPAGGTDN